MGGKSFAGAGFIKSLYQTYASGKLRNSLTNLILEKNVDESVASVFIGRFQLHWMQSFIYSITECK